MLALAISRGTEAPQSGSGGQTLSQAVSMSGLPFTLFQVSISPPSNIVNYVK